MSEFFRRDKLKPDDKVVFLFGKNIITDKVRRVSNDIVETKSGYLINVTNTYPTKEALLESLVVIDYTK